VASRNHRIELPIPDLMIVRRNLGLGTNAPLTSSHERVQVHRLVTMSSVFETWLPLGIAHASSATLDRRQSSSDGGLSPVLLRLIVCDDLDRHRCR